MNRNKEMISFKELSDFKYINPKSNDELSLMCGLDLQELIILLDDFYITLRDTLALEKTITFGLEIEFEKARRKIIEKRINENLDKGWIIKNDNSLVKGAEINSPILNDNVMNWENLDKVCTIVEPLASIDKNSGGHIHFGTQILGNNIENWLNFIKIWSVYENIIYRFVYGEFLTARPGILNNALPVSKYFMDVYNLPKEDIKSMSEFIKKVALKRGQAVNLNNVYFGEYDYLHEKNTIEFRCPNGTLKSSIWQNNVNFLAKLLLYSTSSSFNNDIIDKRYKSNKDKVYELKHYNEIFLEQALELSDLIFDNNLDKLYFLKQYLKSFEICKYNQYGKTVSLTK